MGFSISSWVLPSYIVTDQKAFTGGVLASGEGQGVVVLAAIECLALAVHSRVGIGRFDRVVGVDAGLGTCGTLQPVTAEELLVTPEGPDVPVIDLFGAFGEVLAHLCVARLSCPQLRLPCVPG